MSATAFAGRAHGGGRRRSAVRRAPRGSPRQSARIERALPSGTQAPPGRVMPPFVTMRAVVASALRSARARSCSLSPYARAVSNTVMPASAAATIVASARSSSRSASVERRMQPRPTRSSPGSSQLSGSSRLRRRTPPIGNPLSTRDARSVASASPSPLVRSGAHGREREARSRRGVSRARRTATGSTAPADPRRARRPASRRADAGVAVAGARASPDSARGA